MRMGEGPQTLIHGDFRLDNILFGVAAEHHPIALVDWQGIIVSKGVHDLAYLLSQNLKTDARREHERDLVAELPRPRSSSTASPGYSAEQCWDDYCVAALWLFEYAIIIGGGLDPANERGTAFMSRPRRTVVADRSSTSTSSICSRPDSPIVPTSALPAGVRRQRPGGGRPVSGAGCSAPVRSPSVPTTGPQRFVYRGTPQQADVSYGFGYLGDTMLQLIEQHDDTPIDLPRHVRRRARRASTTWRRSSTTTRLRASTSSTTASSWPASCGRAGSMPPTSTPAR